jgi:hypothetical protein
LHDKDHIFVSQPNVIRVVRSGRFGTGSTSAARAELRNVFRMLFWIAVWKRH